MKRRARERVESLDFNHVARQARTVAGALKFFIFAGLKNGGSDVSVSFGVGVRGVRNRNRAE